MKRSLRSAAKRAGAPFLGPLDRRFAEFAEAQRREMERIDERLDVDLRIVDEHLLAVRRALAAMQTPARTIADAVDCAVLDGDIACVIVAKPGIPIHTPEGFEEVTRAALLSGADGAWIPGDAGDEATLRIVQLRRR
jgi:hypothetical protein